MRTRWSSLVCAGLRSNACHAAMCGSTGRSHFTTSVRINSLSLKDCHINIAYLRCRFFPELSGLTLSLPFWRSPRQPALNRFLDKPATTTLHFTYQRLVLAYPLFLITA